MVSVAYISAVLGSLVGVRSNAHDPSVVAKVVLELHRLNAMLHWLETAVEAGKPPANANEVRHSVHIATSEEMRKLRNLGLVVSLLVNASVPVAYPGSRLRIELPGTAWDDASPLYFTSRDAQ